MFRHPLDLSPVPGDLVSFKIKVMPPENDVALVVSVEDTGRSDGLLSVTVMWSEAMSWRGRFCTYMSIDLHVRSSAQRRT